MQWDGEVFPFTLSFSLAAVVLTWSTGCWGLPEATSEYLFHLSVTMSTDKADMVTDKWPWSHLSVSQVLILPKLSTHFQWRLKIRTTMSMDAKHYVSQWLHFYFSVHRVNIQLKRWRKRPPASMFKEGCSAHFPWSELFPKPFPSLCIHSVKILVTVTPGPLKDFVTTVKSLRAKGPIASLPAGLKLFSGVKPWLL